jgi:hypothetical protein
VTCIYRQIKILAIYNSLKYKLHCKSDIFKSSYKTKQASEFYVILSYTNCMHFVQNTKEMIEKFSALLDMQSEYVLTLSQTLLLQTSILLTAKTGLRCHIKEEIRQGLPHSASIDRTFLILSEDSVFLPTLRVRISQGIRE